MSPSGMQKTRFARFPRGTVLASVLLVLASTRGAAQSEHAVPHCVPVSGTVATNFLDPNTTLGVATGDLRGAVSATLLGVKPGANNHRRFRSSAPLGDRDRRHHPPECR